MRTKIDMKPAVRWLILLSSVPAMAQDAAVRVIGATNCASCPPPAGTNQTTIPGDPTWFIAGMGVGLLLGIIGTWVFDLRKRR
jgi:hypothetical protein